MVVGGRGSPPTAEPEASRVVFLSLCTDARGSTLISLKSFDDNSCMCDHDTPLDLLIATWPSKWHTALSDKAVRLDEGYR